MQIQLLRALQERKVRPIGSNKEIQVDVRLVSATNENLEQAIEKGTFREDLYHRINEFTLRMPQLKDRREDILLFANFFLDQANRELDKHLIGFDEKASKALLEYQWPGNLRQMKISSAAPLSLHKASSSLWTSSANCETKQYNPPACRSATKKPKSNISSKP